jgi:hypothetical protein
MEDPSNEAGGSSGCGCVRVRRMDAAAAQALRVMDWRRCARSGGGTRGAGSLDTGNDAARVRVELLLHLGRKRGCAMQAC